MATLAPHPVQPTLLDLLEESAVAPAWSPDAPAAAPASMTPDLTLAGERTLEDLVLGAWEELAVAHAASCPLCTGPLVPRFGAGARPVGGRCAQCASEVG